MKFSKNIIICSFLLGGCLTLPNHQTEPVYSQSLTRAQIEQLKIDQQQQVKQQQIIIQNNNRSQRVYVHQPYQPYPVNPPAQSNDIHRVQVGAPVQSSQQGGYHRRQDDLNRQATEAAQLEQARQNSLATHAREEARRQERAAEEARQIERATQESLRTHAEETAKRQQAAAVAAQPVISQPVVSQPVVSQPVISQPVVSSQPVVPPPVVAVPEWEPNSGHHVRAGELVMDLKRSKNGVSPTHDEMNHHLIAKMGITATQAEKILEELGL
ncbi:MAG: hypothetical protein ACOH2E_04995 [Candidatus Paracaedibacter sp.]